MTTLFAEDNFYKDAKETIKVFISFREFEVWNTKKVSTRLERKGT